MSGGVIEVSECEVDFHIELRHAFAVIPVYFLDLYGSVTLIYISMDA